MDDIMKMKIADPVQTEMRLHKGVEWVVSGHVNGDAGTCDHDVPRAQIILRRIGWLDQKGNVWISSQDWQNAGAPNGSITPLLIAEECD
jgi:hypothetical protein